MDLDLGLIERNSGLKPSDQSFICLDLGIFLSDPGLNPSDIDFICTDLSFITVRAEMPQWLLPFS